MFTQRRVRYSVFAITFVYLQILGNLQAQEKNIDIDSDYEDTWFDKSITISKNDYINLKRDSKDLEKTKQELVQLKINIKQKEAHYKRMKYVATLSLCAVAATTILVSGTLSLLNSSGSL